MTNLIDRNSSIPIVKTKVFTTDADNQPGVLIQVFEGDKKFTKDNQSLGKFSLEGISPAPSGTPRIEVKFEMTANGVLFISTNDMSTGNIQKITITNKKKKELEPVYQPMIMRLYQKAEGADDAD